jgi:hypothetical protein
MLMENQSQYLQNMNEETKTVNVHGIGAAYYNQFFGVVQSN